MQLVVVHMLRFCSRVGAVVVLLVVSLHAAGIAQPDNDARQSRILFLRDGQLWAVTPDGSETTGPFAIVEPISSVAASPDGRYLACVGSAKGGLRIYRMLPDVELVEVQRLQPGLVYIRSIVWSPDARYLAVFTVPQRRGQTPGGEPVITPEATPDDALLGITPLTATEWALHILPWHTDEERLPKENGEGAGLSHAVLFLPRAWGVTWAPSSDAIAFVQRSEADGRGPNTICVTDLATGHTTDIAPTTDAGVLQVRWRSDGNSLAYTTGSVDGIHVVPTDGSTPGELLVPDEDQCSSSPRWSPDGSCLAFSRRWGKPTVHARPTALWVLDLESGQETNLTNAEIDVYSDSIGWSPNGALIAFYGDTDAWAECDLYISDPVSGLVTLVQEGCDWWPAGAGVDFGGGWDRPTPWLPPLAAAEGGAGGGEETIDPN